MKQVTAIVAGAGRRGRKAYASYALDNPNELKIVGVAEPDEEKREAFREEHNIPGENCFKSWEELLSQPKMADGQYALRPGENGGREGVSYFM